MSVAELYNVLVRLIRNGYADDLVTVRINGGRDNGAIKSVFKAQKEGSLFIIVTTKSD